MLEAVNGGPVNVLSCEPDLDPLLPSWLVLAFTKFRLLIALLARQRRAK